MLVLYLDCDQHPLSHHSNLHQEAPGLHWVFIFETEIFSPEVAMAENSKSGVNFQKIVQQEMKFEVVNKVIGDVVRIAIESLSIEIMKFMMDSITLHLGMMRTVTTCWS